MATLPFKASVYNRVVPGVPLRFAPGYVLVVLSGRPCYHVGHNLLPCMIPLVTMYIIPPATIQDTTCYHA